MKRFLDQAGDETYNPKTLKELLSVRKPVNSDVACRNKNDGSASTFHGGSGFPLSNTSQSGVCSAATFHGGSDNYADFEENGCDTQEENRSVREVAPSLSRLLQELEPQAKSPWSAFDSLSDDLILFTIKCLQFGWSKRQIEEIIEISALVRKGNQKIFASDVFRLKEDLGKGCGIEQSIYCGDCHWKLCSDRSPCINKDCSSRGSAKLRDGAIRNIEIHMPDLEAYVKEVLQNNIEDVLSTHEQLHMGECGLADVSSSAFAQGQVETWEMFQRRHLVIPILLNTDGGNLPGNSRSGSGIVPPKKRAPTPHPSGQFSQNASANPTQHSQTEEMTANCELGKHLVRISLARNLTSEEEILEYVKTLHQEPPRFVPLIRSALNPSLDDRARTDLYKEIGTNMKFVMMEERQSFLQSQSSRLEEKLTSDKERASIIGGINPYAIDYIPIRLYYTQGSEDFLPDLDIGQHFREIRNHLAARTTKTSVKTTSSSQIVKLWGELIPLVILSALKKQSIFPTLSMDPMKSRSGFALTPLYKGANKLTMDRLFDLLIDFVGKMGSEDEYKYRITFKTQVSTAFISIRRHLQEGRALRPGQSRGFIGDYLEKIPPHFVRFEYDGADEECLPIAANVSQRQIYTDEPDEEPVSRDRSPSLALSSTPHHYHGSFDPHFSP